MWVVAPVQLHSHISHIIIIIKTIIIIARKGKKCFEFTLLVTYRPLTPHAHRETAPGLAFFETILGGFSQVQDTACFVISGLG